MRALAAFLRRDVRESRSYFTTWLVEGFSILLTVLTFYFLGQLIDQSSNGAWSPQGISYFGFAVNGIAMASLLSQVIRGHSSGVRQAQMTGTLEAMLLAPVPSWQIAVGGAFRGILRGLLRLVAYLALAAAFGALTIEIRLLWLPVLLLVALLSFLPFGLLAASYVVVFKRGDPFAHLTNAATLLLAGVYFPPSILPEWLRPASLLYPVSHAVAALRRVTLGMDSPLEPLLWLAAFAATALPASAWLFDRSIAHARKLGTLGHI